MNKITIKHNAGNSVKLFDAIQWLGRKYIFHPANRVGKLEVPIQAMPEPRVLKAINGGANGT